MKPKSKAELEQEMREFYDSPKMKGSGIRFVGFGKRKPLVLTPAQKAMLKRCFDDSQARSKAQTKPAAKRKAA